MGTRSRNRFVVADAAVVTIVAIAILLLGWLSSSSGGSSGGMPPNAISLTLQRDVAGRPVPAGFLGVSFEYNAVEPYAGDDPLAVDPVLEQLIRGLSPGQTPVLRIGGDTTDSTWWPVSGMQRPPGVTFTLDERWLQVVRALREALGARLILGINLEADSVQLAGAEAQALVRGIGRSTLDALELGNEPVLYGGFPWYRTPDGRGVPGRPASYDFTAFTQDFKAFGDALPHVPLAGPALGKSDWMGELGQFLAAEPRIGLVTLHRYPLQLCFIPRGSQQYPTIGHLLSAAASTGLAEGLAPYVAIAHARGLPVRVDEINTVSCGADPAISNTFASALWVLDALFEMARVGVDGVNMHTFPGAGYELFRFKRMHGRWRASVAPEYYGLLMFSRAAPPGSRLVMLSGASSGRVKSWATRTPDGTVRVALINKGTRPRVVSLRLPQSASRATVERLAAPSLRAADGVTLGGQSLAPDTDTGRLAGRFVIESVGPIDGRYVIHLPAASAELLTVR